MTKIQNKKKPKTDWKKLPKSHCFPRKSLQSAQWWPPPVRNGQGKLLRKEEAWERAPDEPPPPQWGGQVWRRHHTYRQHHHYISNVYIRMIWVREWALWRKVSTLLKTYNSIFIISFISVYPELWGNDSNQECSFLHFCCLGNVWNGALQQMALYPG